MQENHEQLAYGIPAAARMMGMSAEWLWKRVRAGEITPIRIGRRVLLERREIERYLEAARSR